jgi:hypothetical protein
MSYQDTVWFETPDFWPNYFKALKRMAKPEGSVDDDTDEEGGLPDEVIDDD